MAIAVAAIGAMALLGWATNLRALEGWAYGLPTMNPLTAVGFLAAPLALMLSSRSSARTAQAVAHWLSAGVVVLGAWRITGVSLGLSAPDVLIYHIAPHGSIYRMSWLTGVLFVLLGAAIPLRNLGTYRSVPASQPLALISGFIVLFVLACYGSWVLNYSVNIRSGPMALPTAVCFGLLSTAILLSQPDVGFMKLLVGTSFSARTGRRYMVAAVLAPLLCGMTALDLARAGTVSNDQALVLFMLAILTFRVLGVFLATHALRNAELERESAQNRLASQQSFLSKVVDSVPNFIFIKNLDGRFLLANRSCAEVYGTTPDGLVGKTDADFASDPEEVEFFLRKDREAIRSGQEIFIAEERITDAEGKIRWLQTIKRPVNLVEGEEVLVLGVCADITERKHMEEELLESREQLRIAHAELERQNSMLERTVKDRTRALEQAQMEMLKRLAIASEFRDDDTGEHTSRVSELSSLIAEELGIPDSEVELIRAAAALHDLGKIGVSDAIFLKPGKLTNEEFEVMKNHTTIASKILGGSSSPLLQMAESIALTHHEKYDGSGYPNGLKGEEIPVYGRIVAVADVFDALTHARPYKRAWPIAKALEEVARLSGTHFDPKIVEVFLALMGYQESRRAA